ncbi:energy-coupling factor transporter transmembrane component T [Lactobacillus sp. PV034]|uniref:energy-coupling factor transporter transmembrane component T n=1 Tax=Lactobacillus sp. PV034 TaxID=2594495 RepID=UPI002240BB56|nr:energy-coupling factor transporter transmembrane component T [Lactobacillus sp. PV034]QNQ80922.1 cobalt transport protein [Lactobacillus sp. PV034]
MDVKNKQNIPKWLKNDSNNPVPAGKKNYVLANIKNVIKILNYFTKVESPVKIGSSPWVRLVLLIAYTYLILTQTNFIVLWIILITFGIQLVMFPGDIILSIIKKLVKLIIISLFLLVPSILFHNQNIELFLIRIGLVLINLSIFLVCTSWQEFVVALDQLHFPQTLILIIDITIKYVYTLGNYLIEILYSVRLRTFGQNVSSKLLGTIIGQLYLFARHRTTEQYQAMVLRGYHSFKKKRTALTFNKIDAIQSGVFIFIIIISIVFRGKK